MSSEPPYVGYLGQLKPCPECGGGDLAWCGISHRPYCRDCNHWGAANYGNDSKAIIEWNEAFDRTQRKADEKRELKELRVKVKELEAEVERLKKSELASGRHALAMELIADRRAERARKALAERDALVEVVNKQCLTERPHEALSPNSVVAILEMIRDNDFVTRRPALSAAINGLFTKSSRHDCPQCGLLLIDCMCTEF